MPVAVASNVPVTDSARGSMEEAVCPPINFVYKHLHDSIRKELAHLTDLVHKLERSLGHEDVLPDLHVLRERYQLLVQINLYHSSVEDEAVYPALEYKVPNVTQAYSVEHGEEECLLDDLQELLISAIKASDEARAEVIHEFVCKVEEVHVTLTRHLQKEEEQLFPLVLQHFTLLEQAELVVQFLCCIPVLAVSSVITWLSDSYSTSERDSLLTHIAALHLDPDLCQLLTFWMCPTATGAPFTTMAPYRPTSPAIPGSLDRAAAAAATTTAASASSGDDPLDVLIHLHRGILHTVCSLTEEVLAIQAADRLRAAALASLRARWRFLCAVSTFHRLSEHHFVYPAARSLGQGEDACQHCEEDHREEAHTLTEVGRLLSEIESVMRRGAAAPGLLAKLTKTARAMASAMEAHIQREEAEMLPGLRERLGLKQKRQLVWRTLQALPLRLLERVMPWLAQHLGSKAFEELMATEVEPSSPAISAVLTSLMTKWGRRAFERPSADGAAVKGSDLFAGAAEVSADAANASPHGGGGGGGAPSAQLHLAYPALTCSTKLVQLSTAQHRRPDTHIARHGSSGSHQSVAAAEVAAEAAAGQQGRGTKRKRDATGSGDADSSGTATFASLPDGGACKNGACTEHRVDSGTQAAERDGAPCARAEHAAAAEAAREGADAENASNPIDHIFQFHKALRRELHSLELDAKVLQAVCKSDGLAVRSSSGAEDIPSATAAAAGAAAKGSGSLASPALSMPPFELSLQRLEGRFLFVGGIYRAHSVSEDEIIFPALEEKQALKNVSHFYVLDHQEEVQLFEGIGDAVADIQALVRDVAPQTRDEAWAARRDELVSKLRQKVASVRASLETHVRAEEAEIWPLFAEHFTIEEQSQLVGAIIGRTGAVVLQALIPWVMGSFAEKEKGAMLDSLRKATKNTHFEAWMDKMVPTGRDLDVLASLDTRPHDGGSGGDAAAAATGPAAPAASASAAAAEDPLSAGFYQPGWEDIFRMNATQLEAAAAATSTIPGEDEHRRDYLMRNLTVSRFLVAQQQRMRMQAKRSGAGASGATADTALSSPRSAAAGAAAGAAAEDGGGCHHYRTHCKLVAPCCGAEVWCRLCHDDDPACQCAAAFDRYSVREMVCQLCHLRQPVAQHCTGCKARMARYYCGVCHLFEDASGREIYHCPFCNMCRCGRGLGIDSFHCMRCNACMSLALFKKHTCRERLLESNCPICHDDLFVSSLPVKELPCGHFMHSTCFAAYTQHAYTCPICYKSVGDLTLYFGMLDRLLLSETLPPELADRRQRIHCHDCGSQGSVQYHYVYHKCPQCASYNTRVL